MLNLMRIFVMQNMTHLVLRNQALRGRKAMIKIVNFNNY